MQANIPRRRRDDRRALQATIGRALLGDIPTALGLFQSAKNSKKLLALKDAFSSVSGPLSNLTTSKRSSKTIDAAVSKGTIVKSRMPNIVRKDRSQLIVHRELINASVSAHSSYTVEGTYPLNPGMATTFPWLNKIAQQYEQFTIEEITFHYVPFVATSTAGTVMMMTDYNAADPAPASETQFMDHPQAVSGPVWAPLSFRCNPKDLHLFTSRRFVRTSLIAGDIKTYDCGNFFLATDNSATTPVGKLYVEYRVLLHTPQLEQSPALAPTTGSFFTIGTQTITLNTLTTATSITPVFNTFGNAIASGVFTVAAGTYKFTVCITFTDNTTELNACSVYCNVNGVQQTANAICTTTTANTYQSATLDLIVSIPSTLPVRFDVACTGPAGILKIQTGTITMLVV